jgi:parvulin-like peptidyl-prolyl isomerase
VKRDLTIALLAAAAVAALCAGLAAMRPPFVPTPSTPFATALTPAVNEPVVMRVNGTAVTQIEFEEAFRQMPEEMQRQFASPVGRQAFAEQYVRLKLLEQEGERAGVPVQAKVKAQLTADRTNVVASTALQQIVKPPTNEAVQAFYNQHRNQFETVELSHIVLAYQGGQIAPRDGQQAPPEQVAAERAMVVYQRLKQGADFARVAAAISDDPASAQNGGRLGPFSKGMLPQEIEAQVFRMAPGQISGPMPSRFGIHIFKVGDRVLQPLDRVRPFVVRQLQQQNAFDRVELLRKQAKVDFDPKYFPEAKTWGQTPGTRPAPPG